MTILGLSLFTWFHTLLSLVMLVAGFVVVKDLLRSHIDATWMAVFLISGVLTNVTGFGFPFSRLTESHYTAIFSLIVLAGAILGLYVFKLAGPWRWIFALSVVSWRSIPTPSSPSHNCSRRCRRWAHRPRATNRNSSPRRSLLLAIIIWLCVKAYRQFRPA